MNHTVVYETLFGSKLYGTSNPNSDLDIKGIFIPALNDVILRKDVEFIKSSTGDNKTRNTKDDIDKEHDSIYKFLDELRKGETGALDILFSMFREDTIVSADSEFVEYMRSKAHLFITKNSKAFVGYCMGQAQRYGIKGSRFGDLIKLKELMDAFDSCLAVDLDKKVQFKDFVELHDQIMNLKYVQEIELKGVKYLSVLGKNYQYDAPYVIVKQSIMNQYNSYGERTKQANVDGGIDWKALSHALRVIDELHELIDTQHLVFPLKTADAIKNVKEGNVQLNQVLDEIAMKLEEIQIKLDNSDLPDQVDQSLIDEIILKFVK